MVGRGMQEETPKRWRVWTLSTKAGEVLRELVPASEELCTELPPCPRHFAPGVKWVTSAPWHQEGPFSL